MISKYTVSKVVEMLGASLLQEGSEEFTIENLLIDSRKISNPEQSVFIAVKGDRHNGHNFVYEAAQKGVKCFIVDEEINQSLAPNCWILKVPNTLFSMQKLVELHRKQFDIPIIGVTGSNGKTIVKEWIYQLLKKDKNIVRSPKSYNSQVGVPLSLWQIQTEHELGIFEAGISQPGEMGSLERMIQPTIGLFTNIGTAHDGSFKNREEKTKEKLRLFQNVGLLVYCRDYEIIHNTIIESERYRKLKTFTWSRKKTADLQVGKIDKQENATIIQAVYQNSFIQISIPFSDEASIENAIQCWALLLSMGYESEFINERMPVLSPIAMRLELKEGINNCSIINDYYNSDLGSLEIALDFLNQQKQHKKKTLIISDILQSGKSEELLYGEVAQLVKQKGINRIVGIGKEICNQQELFNLDASFYESTAQFVADVDLSSFNQETILLKGSRPFGFEKIATLFQKRVHETVLEINLNALVNNLNTFKTQLNPNTKLMAMVKAFSYGSGSFEIANVLQFHRVDYLAVAYADEGVELRKAGITLPIMVMNPEPQGYDAMIHYNLEPEIFSFRVLALFEKAIERNKAVLESPYPVHIKLDTGMHRLGFEQEDLNSLVVHLKNNKALKVKSVFSHLAASDEPHQKEFTLRQINQLKHMVEYIEGHYGSIPIKHILNSAGIVNYPEAQMNMVRLGVGLYGVAPNEEWENKLEQVGELKTTISQIKKVQANESIGYSRSERPKQDITIATVPIGYADGLRRSLGNRRGHMVIDGQRVPIIGNVCMDMCMLDISNVPAKEGDEVIVFGDDYPIKDFARDMETIPYEALTSISPRVKRVYFQE